MNVFDKTKWVSALIKTDLYKTEITTDTHQIIADEPVELGGKDIGPDPGDFLRMSLASCTAITLRMYANRKGFDVSQIEVKVHTEQHEGKVVFRSSIFIAGNIDEQQRKRMLQIAKACPVHKVLTNPIEVVTEVV
jgi:putative redox protein